MKTLSLSWRPILLATLAAVVFPVQPCLGQTLEVRDSLWVKVPAVYSRIVVRPGGVLVADGPITVSGSIVVENGGVVTHSPGHLPGLRLEAADSIVVKGLIDVSEKGLRGGNHGSRFGPVGEAIGADGSVIPGATGSGTTAAGGSHGGFGAARDGSVTNSLYGSVPDPAHPGSGGGSAGASGLPGGDGGGAVRLQAAAVLIEYQGRVKANGGDAASSADNTFRAGAGSGGSIRIVAGSLRLYGGVEVKGGSGEDIDPPAGQSPQVHQFGGGAGGGGRISLEADELDIRTSLLAAGGCSQVLRGGPGTAYRRDFQESAGELDMDNSTLYCPCDLSMTESCETAMTLPAGLPALKRIRLRGTFDVGVSGPETVLAGAFEASGRIRIGSFVRFRSPGPHGVSVHLGGSAQVDRGADLSMVIALFCGGVLSAADITLPRTRYLDERVEGLFVEGSGLTLMPGSTLRVGNLDGTSFYGTLHIREGARLLVDSDSVIVGDGYFGGPGAPEFKPVLVKDGFLGSNDEIGTMIVEENGVVTHSQGLTRGLVLNITGDLIVRGRIDVDQKGLRGGLNDGNPSTLGETYDAGGNIFPGVEGSAGHGGPGDAGQVYGFMDSPVHLGSGGEGVRIGDGGTPGGNGGGLVRIRAGRVDLLGGEIRANGLPVPCGFFGCGSWAGSGGSVYIQTGRFEGGGRIQAASYSDLFQGDVIGGGGRIAVYYERSAFGGSLDPGFGTLFLKADSAAAGDASIFSNPQPRFDVEAHPTPIRMTVARLHSLDIQGWASTAGSLTVDTPVVLRSGNHLTVDGRLVGSNTERPAVIVKNGAELGGRGLVVGPVLNAGLLRLGGEFRIEGDYAQIDTGALFLDNGLLAVADTVLLNGLLDVRFPAWAVDPEDAIIIIQGYEGVTGAFQAIRSNLPSHQEARVIDWGDHLRAVIAAPRRPFLSVATDSLAFGPVSVGDTTMTRLLISNLGGAPLSLNHVDLPSTDWSIDRRLPATINGRGFVNLGIRYHPLRVEGRVDTLRLFTSDPERPAVPVRLHGDARDLTARLQVFPPSDTVSLGTDTVILVQPGEYTRIESGRLWFGRGPHPPAFSSLPLNHSSQGPYAVVPGTEVTELGLGYYVEIENSGAVRTQPAGAPHDSVLFQPVTSPHAFETAPQRDVNGRLIQSSDIVVQVILPRGTVFESGTLFAREGAGSSFLDVPVEMGPQGLAARIPGALVGARGVEYMTVVQTPTRRLTDPVEGGRQAHQAVSVTVTRLEEPGLHAVGKYRLFSVPLSMNGSVATMLSDDLGRADVTQWRLFEFVPRALRYEELTLNSSARFEQGRGYWLIARSDSRIDSDPDLGLTAPTDVPFRIPIETGFNLVGCPFAFPVPWDSVRVDGLPFPMAVAAGLVDRPVAWDPDRGYEFDVSVLEPFSAYWVRAGDVASLDVLPVEAVSGAPPAKPDGRQSSDVWQTRITVAHGRFREDSIVFGVQPGAQTGQDSWDRFKPPVPPGGGTSMYFPHPDWDRPGAYARDLRPVLGDVFEDPASGHSWAFNVSNHREDPEERETELAMDGISSVPEYIHLRLVDRALNRSMDPRTIGSYRFRQAAGKPDVSGDGARFLFLAGNKAFLDEQLKAEIADHPGRSRLFQSRPNPFGPSVAIRFSLCSGGEVRLRIFDAGGRVVRTLLDRHLTSGDHEAAWEGKSDEGRDVSDGIYFYRLDGPGISQTRKMIRIR